MGNRRREGEMRCRRVFVHRCRRNFFFRGEVDPKVIAVVLNYLLLLYCLNATRTHVAKSIDAVSNLILLINLFLDTHCFHRLHLNRCS